jgi:YggT family protein
MLLDAITQVELFIDVFISVYTLALFAYILTSWVQLPYSLRPVQRFLHDVCEPFLRFWRRVLPLPAGPIDLSPIIGFFALIAFDRIAIAVLERLH